jgi:hypothetical protein
MICRHLIHALLAAVAFVLAGCSSFSTPGDRSERIAMYRKYPVGRILYSDASDAVKLQQLRPYVRVGARPSKQLSEAAGHGSTFSHGVGFGETMFLCSGLQLRVYPDGVVYGIGFSLPAVGFGPDDKHWLITETALQWPRISKKPDYHLWNQ